MYEWQTTKRNKSYMSNSLTIYMQKNVLVFVLVGFGENTTLIFIKLFMTVTIIYILQRFTQCSVIYSPDDSICLVNMH